MKKLDLVTTQDLYYLFLLSLLQFSKTCFYLSMYYLFWNPTSFLDAPKCWEFNVLMEPLQDSWWSLFFYFFFLSSFGIKSCKIVEFPDIDRHLTFIIKGQLISKTKLLSAFHSLWLDNFVSRSTDLKRLSKNHGNIVCKKLSSTF